MMAWIRLLAGRLFSGLVVLWFVLSGVFALTYLLPADPARAAVGPHADTATVERVRARMCLDRPLLVQYGCHVGRIARGDLGTSFRTQRPVTDLLLERFGPTAELALAAIALQSVFALLFGLIAAARRDTAADHAVQIGAVLLQSVPPFVLGPLLIYFFAYRLELLPPSGAGEAWGERARHLVLPALTLAAGGIAAQARLLRAELEGALGKDHIRAARAKGVSPWALLIRHALPNAVGPVIALAGVDLGVLLGGAAVTEYIFGWPGLGREAVLGILELDLPVVLGVVLVAGIGVVIASLFADLAHASIDPRIRPR